MLNTDSMHTQKYVDSSIKLAWDTCRYQYGIKYRIIKIFLDFTILIQQLCSINFWRGKN